MHGRKKAAQGADGQCARTEDKNKVFDSMPMVADTFWRNDLTKPPGLLSGHEIFLNKRYNKELGFTVRERQIFSIHGLLPIAVRGIEQQILRCKKLYDSMTSKLQRCVFLQNLESTNRHLFYRLLLAAVDSVMHEISTSSAEFLLRNYSLMFMNPSGMFITIKDKGHVFDVLANWPYRNVRCLLVSDGSEVMSLGDHGANAMAICLVKLHQNTVFGGINPDCSLPIILDVGTNNEELLHDPLYVGLRQRRAPAEKCEEFFEEFTQAVIQLYGPRVLIMCKDFETQIALKLLERFNTQQNIINMDIQVLGACGLAGLLASGLITHKNIKDHVLMFYGTNPFNIGMANLFVAYLKREGVDEISAQARVWFCDEHGLMVRSKKSRLPDRLHKFAHNHKPIPTLAEAIAAIKPNVLVGSCSQPNSFTSDVLNAMEQSAEQPIIYAMSRPVEKAECTPEDAFVRTKGRCIFISGSMLPPLKYGNKWYKPGNCNIVLMLPGIVLGVMVSGITSIPEEMFLEAAERLSHLVWPDDLAQRNVFPPHRKVQCINLQVASAVFTFAYRRRLATFWPEPQNPITCLESQMYQREYRQILADTRCLSKRYIGTKESRKNYPKSTM